MMGTYAALGARGGVIELRYDNLVFDYQRRHGLDGIEDIVFALRNSADDAGPNDGESGEKTDKMDHSLARV